MVIDCQINFRIHLGGHTASDWIDKISQHVESQDAWRRHVQDVLPEKMEQFWQALQAALRQDIGKIATKFSHITGEIVMETPGADEIVIRKIDFPAYRITLTLRSRSIQVENVVTEGASFQPERTPLVWVGFDLDKADNLIVKSNTKESWTATELSEQLLKPILLRVRPQAF